MTNPYHDEMGRFSSQNGMRNAIDRVAANGNVSDYLSMREDYDTAVTPKTVSEPRSPWAPPIPDTTPLTGADATLCELLIDYGVQKKVADMRVRGGLAVKDLQACKTIEEASNVLSSLGVDEYEAEDAAYELMSRK